MADIRSKKTYIQTPRLVLKPYDECDMQELLGLLYNEEIGKTFMVPVFSSAEEAEKTARRLIAISRSDDRIMYGAYLEGKLIGFVNDCGTDGDTVEVGYVVHPGHRGRGYATEMLSAVIGELFRIGFTRVEAGHFEENPASRRVMEKSGMHPISKEEYIDYRGRTHRCLFCAIEKKGKTDMKKLLITAFEPFGGDPVNSAERAVSLLPERIGGWEIHKATIPVVFGKAAECAVTAAEECGASAVLCIGQAGGRDAVTPEMVAINLMHASIKDNGGNQPLDTPVSDKGPAAYFSTMPVRKMAEAAAQAGVRARVSYSAGTFVCNDIYYRLLDHYAGTDVRVGFVHVPYCPGQGEPSIGTADTARALTKIIEAIGE